MYESEYPDLLSPNPSPGTHFRSDTVHTSHTKNGIANAVSKVFSLVGLRFWYHLNIAQLTGTANKRRAEEKKGGTASWKLSFLVMTDESRPRQ
jgi:ribosomal protein L23